MDLEWVEKRSEVKDIKFRSLQRYRLLYYAYYSRKLFQKDYGYLCRISGLRGQKETSDRKGRGECICDFQCPRPGYRIEYRVDGCCEELTHLQPGGHPRWWKISSSTTTGFYGYLRTWNGAFCEMGDPGGWPFYGSTSLVLPRVQRIFSLALDYVRLVDHPFMYSELTPPVSVPVSRLRPLFTVNQVWYSQEEILRLAEAMDAFWFADRYHFLFYFPSNRALMKPGKGVSERLNIHTSFYFLPKCPFIQLESMDPPGGRTPLHILSPPPNLHSEQIEYFLTFITGDVWNICGCMRGYWIFFPPTRTGAWLTDRWGGIADDARKICGASRHPDVSFYRNEQKYSGRTLCHVPERLWKERYCLLLDITNDHILILSCGVVAGFTGGSRLLPVQFTDSPWSMRSLKWPVRKQVTLSFQAMYRVVNPASTVHSFEKDRIAQERVEKRYRPRTFWDFFGLGYDSRNPGSFLSALREVIVFRLREIFFVLAVNDQVLP